MKLKNSWFEWFSLMLNEFVVESVSKPQFEIVDIFECKKSGFTKAVIKLSERHTQEKNISDIIMNNDLIANLDAKTVRTLTYIATIERLKPDYSIVLQQMTNEIDDYILEIKSKNSGVIMKKTPSELTRDVDLIAKFNSVEANRIGYMAGVRETVKEYQVLTSNT